MKKTLLLFLLLPFFGFAQTEISKWNASMGNRYTPVVNTNLNPLDVTVNGGVNINYISYNDESTFFQTGNWPVPQQNGTAYDANKYIQFSIEPKTGYKADVTSFTFQCRSGSGKFKVRYSKDATFTNGVFDLITETNNPSDWTTFTRTLSNDLNPVLQNEKVYIRIYSYSTNNTFEIKTGTLSSNIVPIVNGTVTSFDATKIMAIKDFVDTKINTGININALNNDVKKENVTSLVVSTQPAATEGRVIVNPDRTLTFNPAKDFVGTSTFNYTISNGTETSTAAIKVTVTNNPDNNLSIWDGAGNSYSPKTNSFVQSNAPVSATGISLNYTFYNTDNAFFQTSGWPTPQENGGKENPAKYVEFKISPDSKHKLNVKQFNFTYRGNNQKFIVKYSKNSDFTTGSQFLITETNTQSNWTALTNTISSSVNPIVPGETLYIRIYSYSSNNTFEIKNGNGNLEGPTITGTVEDVYTLTANDDYVSTPTNQAATISILNNDVIGGFPLQSISLTQPANGTVALNGSNQVVFTPSSSFTGSTSFTYTLRNTNTPPDYSSATVFVNGTAPLCTVPGDQTTFGTNAWIGYVYKWTGNIPPNPATPSTAPDSSIATYIGTVTEAKYFDRNVGEAAIAGATTNIPCEAAPIDKFFVRYKMTATVAETGDYNITLAGDDGIRLYIDNQLVLTRWNDHSYTVDAVLRNVTAGTHNFVIEYYENAGAARATFLMGLVKGDRTLPYGDKVWNVYGFSKNNLDLTQVVYAGNYVDSNLNVDSRNYWAVDKSPSAASNWQGATMQNDNFTVSFRRQGFTCGAYQIQLANSDDATQIYLDGTLLYTQNGYTNTAALINNGQIYNLKSTSKIEIRLREDGGNANVAVNFIKVPNNYNGSGNPGSDSAITISSNTTLGSDLTVCSCTINPNVVLTIPNGLTLTVDEDITVGTGGKLVVQNGGSLLQTTNSKTLFSGSNTSFELIRDTQPVRRYDFTYWSAPVTFESNYKLKDLSPNTLGDKYYAYDAATAAWKIDYNGASAMALAKGYSVRAPQTYDINGAGQVYTATFKGIPNNGDIDATTTNAKWNLIGNPYPSAIDAETFINQNFTLNAVETGALYFWTHKSLPSSAVAGDAKYNYTSDDYAVFNLTGHVVTHNSTVVGDGFIASGQAFFVKPTGTKSIIFNNNMRVGGKNGQFFKPSTAKTSDIEKNRLWLNFSNDQGAFKQALLGYMEGATNGIDLNYDATTMSGNSYVDFYTISNAKKLTIQARALPFTDTEEIPLGYKTTVAGDFTIAIDHVDGLFTDQAVYLEDKTTGKIQDLRAGNYTFNTAVGTFTDRFVLKYTNKTLGTGDFETSSESVLISVKDKVINITSSQENIKEVLIYNIAGQQLYIKNKINSSEHQISNLQSGEQVLLAKVTMENGYTVTKKIIFH